MNEDAALLRRYAEGQDQEAFAELVRRHVDLVYAAAVRRMEGDAYAARDVAQQVFVRLARHAGRLVGHGFLVAWLHTATRNAAIDVRRAERQRKVRERAVQAMNESTHESARDAEWLRIRPVLDDAIDDLGEGERVAVLLRFFEQRSFAEIGARLSLSEDAARMRVDRALDKLRGALARRGVTSTAGALSLALGAQAVTAAPAGLAGALAAGSLGTAGAGALLFGFMTTKSIIATAIVAAGFLVGGAYVGTSYARSQTASLEPTAPIQPPPAAALRDENLRLRSELTRLGAAAGGSVSTPPPAPAAPPPAATVMAAVAAPPPAPPPQLSVGRQQEKIVSNLRQIANARRQFEREHGRPATSLQDLVGPDKFIKSMPLVDGENYGALSFVPRSLMQVTTTGGILVTFDEVGSTTTQPIFTPAEVEGQRRLAELEGKMRPAIERAMRAYREARPDGDMKDPTVLEPYIAPETKADFAELVALMKFLGR